MTLKNGIILLKKCRPINLLTIIILQCFLYYFLIYKNVEAHSIDLRLSFIDLVLLTLDLALIMAAGYLINDIFDIETDEAHQSKESLLNTGLPLSFFHRSYWIILIFGMGLTLYLAYKYDEWYLSLLYPVGAFLLYIYAKHLKSSVLWGNILIAILCGFPATMLFLAESPAIEQLKQLSYPAYKHFMVILGFYLVFAFFSTLIREIIKDLEDKEADLKAGIISFANSKPYNLVFGLCSTLIFCFVGLQVYFCFYLFEQENNLALLFFIICIIPLTVISTLRLKKAHTSSEYRTVSRIYKAIILSGIIILAFI